MVIVGAAINGLRDISKVVIPWEKPEVVWEHPEGAYSVCKCDTPRDWNFEGYFLAHCLGTKEYEEFSKAHVVYSLRDKRGIPHATILCLREDEFSPYGAAWDIGSILPFQPEDEPLRILQVRGREDDIAHPVFHCMVREWYVAHGGIIQADIANIVEFLRVRGDSDENYHFRYLMDDSVNWKHTGIHL